jgi:2-methylisocitrate lyase-like PEP mutase family enzyme
VTVWIWVAGTPQDCIRGAREVAQAGADLILFTPLFDEPEHMERLATEVVPALA